MMAALRWLISLPFRILGYLLVVAGVAAGIVDVYRSVIADRVVLTPLGQLWRDASPETLALAQPAVQRYLHPAIWDPGVQTLLRLPGWLSLFIVAALILLLAQLIYQAK
ncbi:hypothetical protein [Acuticoccus sp.]|uniref:hypothetical protein n=1 Tax=Acuticoccus sp. TaxID=1904378 RepID=UPI003B51EC3A